jgi:hypothetical protein
MRSGGVPVKRLVVAMVVALVVAALAPAAATAAPPPDKNRNDGEVVFTCEDGTEVTIWVNLVASDRGSENPAIVVAGSEAQVFKLVSYQLGDDSVVYASRFPTPPPFDLVTCTHSLELEGGEIATVTLTGVFIP